MIKPCLCLMQQILFIHLFLTPSTECCETADNDPNGTTALKPLVFRTPDSYAPRSYNVFDMQGRFVAKFTTQGIEDLQAKTAAAVNRAGTYLVRSKSGKTFRINVR